MVATTRPELLPACVALVAHPDDARYAGLIGSSATTPLFGVRVPILAHHLADPGKGTGLVMVCTFGDMTDVIWWRELQLETRPVIGKDGRLLPAPPPGIVTRRGNGDLPPTRRLAGKGRQAASQRSAGRGRPAARRARADPARREVLRIRPGSAGDHHDPPVVHPQWQPVREAGGHAAGSRPRAALASRAHAGQVRALGGRADRRLADQPPALQRRANPAVVPAG